MSRAVSGPYAAAVRTVRGATARLRATAEGGYMLLETIIAISLITVVMAAVGAEYVSGVAATNHQRLQTTAVQLAESTMDNLRAFDPSDLVTGRTQDAVTTEYNALSALTNVRPKLNNGNGSSTTAATYRAYSSDSSQSSAIPTTATTQRVGAVTYSIWQYLECVGPAAGGSCASTLGATSGSTTVNSIRAVVVVTWSQRGCPANTCAYTSSTVVNADADPTFDLNQPLPPAPVISDPGPLTVAIGDTVSFQLTTTEKNPGVAPLTWTLQSGSLPKGLSMSPGGLVTGTVTGAATAGVTGTTAPSLVVTDSYTRPSTAQKITWTVVPQLSLTALGNQANFTTDSVGVALAATGGSGAVANYSFSDPNGTLPAGLSVSADGVVSGTPTPPGAGNAPKTYPVQLTVTDTAACPACASPRTATTTFNWTISYPPLALTQPADQTWTLGTALLANAATPTGQVQMAASGGDGNYAWSATGLPSGVSINATTGLISGTPPTTAANGTATVTVTDAGASTDTSSPQYRTAITFKWTLVAKPTVTPPAAQKNSIGASPSVPVTSTCANAPCTYALNSAAPAGLSIDSTGTITGTITATAKTYSVTVTVTDAAGAVVTSPAFSWVVVAAPTMSGFATKRVTETTMFNQQMNWTCGYSACTIAMTGGMVPGVGLETSANLAGDNSGDTSVTVTGTSGTVFVTGTVADTAVTSGTSAQYKPSFTITAADGATRTYGPYTYTAFAPPTLGAVADRDVTETANESVGVSYRCYSATSSTPCTIALTGAPAGIGLSTTANATGDQSASTSVSVTSTAAATVYLTGTVQDTAVTGTATKQAYTPTLTITDNAGYTSPGSSGAWNAFVVPTVTAPATQRNTIGQAVNQQLTTTCANAPCSYTSANLPAGLTIDPTGLISGTVATAAVSSSAVTVTVTDADGVTATTAAFTWTIDAAPTLTGLTNRTLTVGAVYNGTTASSIGYTCPRANCTIVLLNPVPGLGLTTNQSATGNQTATSLTVTAASGTVYIAGTVQTSAVTSGSSSAYATSLRITDGGNFSPTATSATWTAFSKPTVGALVARNVSVGAVDNVAVAYTCPTAGTQSCVLALSGAVPGTGLSATPNKAGDNSAATTLTVGSASGTVYITGTVQSSALASGSPKTWNPSLTITDGGNFTSTASTAAWKAFAAPTIGSLAARSMTVGATDSVAISYTCPDAACTIALSGSVPGLGLGTASQTTTNTVTSLNVTATSGTVYVSGLVGAGAVTGGALNQVWNPSLTINDGSTYTSTATPPAWTAYAAPSVQAPYARDFTETSTNDSTYSYSCPRAPCTITISGSVPGIGVNSAAGGTGDRTATTTLTISTAGTGNFYMNGTVQTSAVTTGTSKAYTISFSIADAGNFTPAAKTATWSAYTPPTMTAPTAKTVARNSTGTQSLNYTCPTLKCVVSFNANPGWVYIGSSPTTTVTLTAASGSITLSGQPVAGSASGSVQLKVTDGTAFSGTTTAVTWTVSG